MSGVAQNGTQTRVPTTHASCHSEPTTAKPGQGRACLKVPGQTQAGSIFGKVDHSEEEVCSSFYNTSSSMRLSGPRSSILNSCKAPVPFCSWPLHPPLVLLLRTTFPRASMACGTRRIEGAPGATVASLGRDADQRAWLCTHLSCLVWEGTVFKCDFPSST